MLFGRKRRPVSSDNALLKIDGTAIECVSKTKFLGVIVDDKFSWSDHISVVNNKISKSLGMMYKAKFLLNEKCMLMLYNSLILPYLDYCCEIWGNTYKSNLSKIIVSQKKAIRYIANSHSHKAHTNPLFHKYKCLKFNDLITYKTSIVMFKANNVLLPPALQKYFVKSSDVHNYNSRNSRNFHTPQVSSKLKSMAISSVGVSIWNYLSKHLNCNNASPLSKFRKECKHFFISNYESN